LQIDCIYDSIKGYKSQKNKKAARGGRDNPKTGVIKMEKITLVVLTFGLAMFLGLNQASAAKGERICTPEKSKPCGNACISKAFNCTKAPGLARWAKPGEVKKSSGLTKAEYDALYGAH